MVRLEEVEDEAFIQEKQGLEDDDDYTDTGKLFGFSTWETTAPTHYKFDAQYVLIVMSADLVFAT